MLLRSPSVRLRRVPAIYSFLLHTFNKILLHLTKLLLRRNTVKKLIECFESVIEEPSDYDEALPDFCNAYVCACISQLCYKSSVEALHTDNSYKEKVRSKLEQWGWSSEDAARTVFINSREIINEDGSYRPGTQGLILSHKETAFVGFRGSERKPNDWFANFNSKKVKSPYAEGEVHRGFLSAFNALVPNGEEGKAKFAFDQEIEKLRSAKAIWLTGHSLGGAIASIAASFLLQPQIDISASKIYVYTFGAPRVGDDSYRQYINRKLQYRYWRFVHKQDIVPDVPLPQIFRHLPSSLVSGFAREGSMYMLNDTGGEVLRRVYQDGIHKVLSHFTGRTARDHGIQFYRDCLFKLCRQKNPDCLEETFKNLPGSETTEEDIKDIEKDINLD